MRDLSALEGRTFDVVHQPYSINFVPSPLPVFEGVRRVLRPGGHYRLRLVNPFVAGMTHRDWQQIGYVLTRRYEEGAEVSYPDQEWVFKGEGQAPPPHEFRHTLGTIIRGLASNGFVVDDLREDTGLDPEGEPGSWGHFQAVAAPWWTLHARVAGAGDKS
jgi:SAM-dependent methyltransferase